MNTTRRGLGRGLGSLIPSRTEDPDRAAPSDAPADATAGPPAPDEAADGAPTPGGTDSAGSGGSDGSRGSQDGVGGRELTPVAGAYFAELSIDAISANPRQPRAVFDEDALAELVVSIREVGLLQPVVVRAAGAGYELIMGERRWRAARAAGLTTIPAIVKETSDDDLLRDALLENLHRADLNPLEEAAAYQQLLDDFGATHDELATRIGRSRPHVTNTIRLLRLSPPVQRRVAAGVLSAGHARALVAVADSDAQDRLAARTVAEGLSVRGLEELIAAGGADSSTTRVHRMRPVAPGLADISARLSERFETRCKVELGRTKGKIIVEFASLDDLQRILAVMEGESAAGALAPEAPEA